VANGKASYDDLLKALQAIENISGDDFCEELDCDNALVRKLRGRIAIAHRKLSMIYRISHSWDVEATCFSVHENWRKEARAMAEHAPASADENPASGERR
jgi:hypothetical protein